MKKKFYKFLIIFICLMAAIPTVIYAAWGNGGGTGSQGGNTGGASGANDCTFDFYWQSGSAGNLEVAAYRFDLVYKTKGGGREIMKSVIVHIPSETYCTWCSRQGFINGIYDYVTAMNATHTATEGTKYTTSGPLADLAKKLLSGKTIDELFGSKGLDSESVANAELIKSYITSSEGFGVDEKTMQKDQDDNPGTYNSYGYRIMIQKLQAFKTGCDDYNPSWWRVMTRKDAASNNAVKRYLVGGKEVKIAPCVTRAAPEIFTTRDDMGVRNANSQLNHWRNAGNGCAVRDSLRPDFADENNGSGYNILWFSTEPFKDYDYTIDAACVNCNSNNSDNKAYVIQDTNDWKAIFASTKSKNNNVVNYYKKGNGVYCREEYQVYLPNATNTVYVEPGRYFTVNPSASALDKVVSAAAIPNLKPIKVVKKRQCKVNPDENKSNASTVLDTFRRNSEYDFKGKTGTIKFKYNETYEDSRYNMSSAEKLNTYDESGNYTYSINNGMLDMQVTKYYTLPDNYYQYIRKQDGLSMKSKPSSHIEYYTNVGIPNLPVSFNNTGVEYGSASKAADIQFLFELPGKNNDADRYSLLYKAYTKDNKYLETDNESGNIYNRYKKNKMKEGDEDLLRNSACAKMYGYKTSAFETCVVNRVNNAIGDGGYNCVANSNINTSTSSGYACVVLTPSDDGGKCSTEEDAKKLGQDWNPYDQTCCPVGTTYNPTLGKCENNGDNTCRIENGKYYDYNGKEISKDEYDRICPNSGDGDTCRIENGKYYDFNGNEITKERYDEICPSNLPPECPVDCEYGCCPSGECAPMPGGVCPGSGGIDVIYRTIDLENPFPGQNAEQRKTGANWCSYNIKTQKIDCKYNNQTVKNYITRERSGTYNGGKVYREDHILYEVTLDSKAIGKVRSYNDKNRYDDWDLKCLDNGKACKSEFLQSVVETTGKCASASKNSFYTCDKDV